VIGAGVVVVVATGIALAAAGSGTHNNHPPDRSPAPKELVAAMRSIPTSVFDRIGPGGAIAPPSPIHATPLVANGKPEVVYIGAEYCPFCATERWPLVISLSRFGTFSHLQTTHSALDDAFPGTPTFSFHGAQYSSDWIQFTAVETHTNEPLGSDYAPLDTLSPAQQKLLATYDNPPYVSSDSSAGIPFIDFGGKYIIDGATYNPSVLQGKTLQQIAAAIPNPASPISQGAIGASNLITATICSLTHNQPASACTDTVQQLEGALG
jgi:hypothetical protein